MTVNPPRLKEKVPSISPAVEEVVMKAISKDPNQRFESVQAFADALIKVTSQQ
jgi:serine/threonine protein kinase